MILNEPYSKELFDSFLKDFLPDYQKDERQVRTTDKSILTEVTQLGTSRDVNVTVLEAECEETDTNKRIAITQAAFKVLRDHSIRNAIIAFHDGADQWRLSLLTSTLDIKNGKVVKKDSNPRRYSYLLGVGAKTVTPYKYLIEKGPVEDIKQLQERFSVEVVNKQFYALIAELFTKLIGGERGATKYPGLLKLNGSVSQNIEHQEFAVRLIGRIIFSWFLKEKKSTAGVPIVPNELLSLDSVVSNADYYHSILEPLFFELLNKRVEQRHENLREAPFSTVPYLNGGLFSPQYNDLYNQSSYSGTGTPGLTHIPDSWFTDLFTILEQYNFTVDENTNYDVELSIDPEMLGRIFENLLAEINPETGESARKSTGSFYTPREIVDYMVDSSLLEFLKNKTNIAQGKLKALISWGQSDDEENPLSDDEKERIVSALTNLTILDPACGSGAFPIGILQKVVYILQQVDEKAELWLQNQIKNINSPEFRRDIEEKYRNGNYDYLRKLGVIRESIFGIDIQTIATEISKLRCFLTLVIDEDVIDDEPNRGIRALPNLDFKFVTANSLVSLPEDEGKHKIKGQPSMLEDTTHIDALKRIRNEYFNAPNDLRNELKNNFYRLQKQMFEATINRFSGTVSSRYSLLSGWDPFEHKATEWFDSEWMFGVNKFDIVIGNPPYIASYGRQAKKFSRVQIQQFLKDYKTFSPIRNRQNASINTVMLFIEKGMNMAKDGAILAYIVDQSILNVDVYNLTRRYILNNFEINEIVSDLQFPQVIAEACILFVSNNKKDLYNIKWKKGLGVPSQLIPSSNIKNNSYKFALSYNQELVSRIESNCSKLKDIANTYTGMQIIPEYFLSNDDDILKLPKWHKAAFSNNIEQYRIIWPAKKQKGKYITYDNDLQELVRSKLAARLKAGEKCRAPETLSIGSREKEARFNSPKIIVSQTVSNAYGKIRLQAALDDVGYYGNVSIHLIQHSDQNFLKFTLALLNSTLMSFYAIEKKLIFGAEKGSKKTPQIRKGSLDLLPIRIPDKVIREEIIACVESLINDSNPNSRSDTYNKIDQLVYKLYGLSPEEIAIIEKSSK